jgi:serine/threonine protein phosphatase PrpC
MGRCSSPFKLRSGSFSSNSRVFGQARGASLQDLIYGVFETKGGRPEMEDRHEVIPFSTWDSNNPSAQGPHFALFAVYDGHGGIQAAEYVRKVLHDNVLKNPHFTLDPERAIFEGFYKTETDFTSKVLLENMDGLIGTTACLALIYENILYLANVGDSGAILWNSTNDEIIQLSHPHTPVNPTERTRVEHAGGVIVNNRLGHPAWNASLINIAVTRAIGDVYFKHERFVDGKHSGLIAEPEITQVLLTTDYCFLLLASDGFWDVVSPREAVDFVKDNPHKDPSSISKELAELALNHSSGDNITVLVVMFKPWEK